MQFSIAKKKAITHYYKDIKTLTMHIVQLLILSMLVCLCIGCGSPTTDTTAIGPTPTHSPASPVAKNPTQIPQPTPTSDIGDTSGSTILGGNIGSFIRSFGNPNGHSNPGLGDYHFQIYPGENVDYLMISADVADGHEFPPASFQDANGNETQSGLFDLQYLYGSTDGTTIDSCSISLGTQGTK